jgi:hypothetical protein
MLPYPALLDALGMDVATDLVLRLTLPSSAGPAAEAN